MGFKTPGGAASSTGAPHCSQYSPSRCNGPLQKRQTTVPGWTAGLSNALLRYSSSTSATSRPSLGRGRSSGASTRGAITTEGAIFKEMVGSGEAAGCAGGKSSASRAGAAWGGRLSAGPAGAGARGAAGLTGGKSMAGRAPAALVPVGAVAASGAPHCRQKRIPSGRLELHFGQLSIRPAQPGVGFHPPFSRAHLITAFATSQAPREAPA